MGKLGAAKKAPGGKVLAGKSPRGKSPQAMRSPATNKPLGTSKGLFSFTSVADGCFIEQKVNQLALISHATQRDSSRGHSPRQISLRPIIFAPPFVTTPSQWGQNSGHVGVPLESIPAFIQRLMLESMKINDN